MEKKLLRIPYWEDYILAEIMRRGGISGGDVEKLYDEIMNPPEGVEIWFKPQSKQVFMNYLLYIVQMGYAKIVLEAKRLPYPRSKVVSMFAEALAKAKQKERD